MSYVSLSEDIVDRASAELDAVRLQIVVIPSHASDVARRVEGLIERCDDVLAKLIDALTDPSLKSSRESVEKQGRYDLLATRHRRLLTTNRNLKEQIRKKTKRISVQSEKLKQNSQEARSSKAESRALSKELNQANTQIRQLAKKVDHLNTEVAWQKVEIEKLQETINDAEWNDEVRDVSTPPKHSSKSVLKVNAKGR